MKRACVLTCASVLFFVLDVPHFVVVVCLVSLLSARSCIIEFFIYFFLLKGILRFIVICLSVCVCMRDGGVSFVEGL